jgi:hypothetical protein
VVLAYYLTERNFTLLKEHAVIPRQDEQVNRYTYAALCILWEGQM